MNEKSSQTKRRPALWVWIVIVLVGLPMLLCGGGVTWFLYRQSVADQQLQTRLAEYTAQGLPIDDATLQQYYQQQTDATNADEWVRILTKIDDIPDAELEGLPYVDASTDPPGLRDAWPNEADAKELLGRLDPELARLRELAKSNRSVTFPRDFDGFATLLPNAQRVRIALRFFSLDHLVAFREGDFARQVADIDAMIGLAIVSRDDPCVVSNLMAIATHQLMVERLQETLATSHTDARACRKLRQRLGQFDDYQKMFANGMIGERAVWLPVFQDVRQIADSGDGLSIPPGVSRSSDALYYLKKMDALDSFDSTSLDKFLKDARQWDAELESEIKQSSPFTTLDRLISQMTLPALGPVPSVFGRQQVANRVGKVALAIREFEAERGRFPNDLDELTDVGLVLEEVAPPFADRFGYRIEDGDALLWCYDVTSDEFQDGSIQLPPDPPTVTGEGGINRELWSWRLPPADELLAPIKATP